MVLTQPVAQFGFDRAEVDLPVLEQRPHPAGPHGGLGEQPAVAFVFVDGEDLFGDPVDVPGAELHHAACRGHDRRYLPALPGQLIETPLQESLVADPVGADQRTGGHATLGQPPRVLDRRRRRFDIIDRHSVFEDVSTAAMFSVTLARRTPRMAVSPRSCSIAAARCSVTSWVISARRPLRLAATAASSSSPAWPPGSTASS